MAIERFTKDHEWIRVEDGIGTVGITHHAQTQLGDIVFVDVPGLTAATAEAGPSAGMRQRRVCRRLRQGASGPCCR